MGEVVAMPVRSFVPGVFEPEANRNDERSFRGCLQSTSRLGNLRVMREVIAGLIIAAAGERDPVRCGQLRLPGVRPHGIRVLSARTA